MNLQVRIERTDRQTLGPLREAYLDGLPHAQVLLVEVMLASADAYLLRARGGLCGYACIARGDTLVEFYLLPRYWGAAETVMRQLVAGLCLRSALVKSFDSLCFLACMAIRERVETVGILGRDYLPQPLPSIDRIRFESRLATLSDLPRIESVDQQVFDDPGRLRHVIEQRYMWLFENDGRVVGFGILTPVVTGRPDVELGIAVDRPFRNKGHAVYMLRELAEQCLRDGLNPVGSCARDNPASRRMAERIGLVGRFLLLEFHFPSRAANATQATATCQP